MCVCVVFLGLLVFLLNPHHLKKKPSFNIVAIYFVYVCGAAHSQTKYYDDSCKGGGGGTEGVGESLFFFFPISSYRKRCCADGCIHT